MYKEVDLMDINFWIFAMRNGEKFGIGIWGLVENKYFWPEYSPMKLECDIGYCYIFGYSEQMQVYKIFALVSGHMIT